MSSLKKSVSDRFSRLFNLKTATKIKPGDILNEFINQDQNITILASVVSAATIVAVPPLGVLIATISIILVRTLRLIKSNKELVSMYSEIVHILTYIKKESGINLESEQTHIKYLKEHFVNVFGLCRTLEEIWDTRGFVFTPNSIMNKLTDEIVFINIELYINLQNDVSRFHEVKLDERMNDVEEDITELKKNVQQILTKVTKNDENIMHIMDLQRGGTTGLQTREEDSDDETEVYKKREEDSDDENYSKLPENEKKIFLESKKETQIDYGELKEETKNLVNNFEQRTIDLANELLNQIDAKIQQNKTGGRKINTKRKTKKRKTKKRKHFNKRKMVKNTKKKYSRRV